MDIEDSLDELSSCVDPPFADRFYAVFLERNPRYRTLFSETDWRSQQAMLTIGVDTVVMCTDGVLEASNPEGELYGIERLADLLREHGANSAKELIQAVKSDLVRHGNGVAADDDIALVAIKWTRRD